MTRPLNVVIVMARCRQDGQGFGLRFEEVGKGRWAADWSFAVKEVSAKREGYDRGEIAGEFHFTPNYPGCPHCQAPSMFLCGCGKVSCWDGKSRKVICPWCSQTVDLEGSIKSLKAGGDR